MKALILILTLSAAVSAQDKTLDLTRPANYANQPLPTYVTKDNTPADNEITDLGATLGRVLFHDKRLSRNNTISCASCHDQSNGFGDTATASVGVAGTTDRHAMRLVNARFSTEAKFFWDERAASAEAQATQPIQDHVEMGFSGAAGDPSFDELVEKLSAIEEYQVLFKGVFGEPTINEERIGKAIAQFVRSIQSFDSKYDAGRAVRNEAQPFPNLPNLSTSTSPPSKKPTWKPSCARSPEVRSTPTGDTPAPSTRTDRSASSSCPRSTWKCPFPKRTAPAMPPSAAPGFRMWATFSKPPQIS